MRVEMWPEAAECARDLITAINNGWPHSFPRSRMITIAWLNTIVSRAKKLDEIKD
jgi:hypothetical protein